MVGRPDLRELFASILLKSINVPCADIVLVYDDYIKEDGCLSMSILKDDEMFLTSEPMFFDNQFDYRTNFEEAIEKDIYSYSQTYPKLPKNIWEKRREYLKKYIFISAFLGNDDIKTDNCQMIYSPRNGTVRNPEYYDMGMSFTGDAYNRCFFNGQSDKEVLKDIYETCPNEIKDLSINIEKFLNKDYIKEILNNPVFDGFYEDEKKRMWNELGDKISLISKYNERLYGVEHQNNSFLINHKELEETSKSTNLGTKDKAHKILNAIINKVIGKETRDD